MKGTIDFALAFAMVHEVPDQKQLLAEIYSSLKKGGQLLIPEPKDHVNKEQFDVTLSAAWSIGFKEISFLNIKSSISVVMEKV